jgi:hypothetical protein
MTREILPLILVSIVFVLFTDSFGLWLPNQLLLGLADAKDDNEYIAELSRESREYSTVRQRQLNSDSAIKQYLLGVIEYNEGNVELAKVWFQQAWESLEAEESNITSPKTQALWNALDKSLSLSPPAKIQFPEGYKINVYYRDGWYIRSRDLSASKKQVYSFLPESTYKIRVEAENEPIAAKRINTGMKVIAALVMISWLMSR